MKKIDIKRYFPCPVCKATGVTEEGDYVDGQQVSPDLECYYCMGEGMIEIGGEIQSRNKALREGMKRIKSGVTYSLDDIMKLGRQGVK